MQKNVLFDMDGVLCDSERFICEAAIEMFKRRHGVQVRAEDFLPFVGSGENRYLGGVAEKYGVQIKVESCEIALPTSGVGMASATPCPAMMRIVLACTTIALRCPLRRRLSRMRSSCSAGWCR